MLDFGNAQYIGLTSYRLGGNTVTDSPRVQKRAAHPKHRMRHPCSLLILTCRTALIVSDQSIGFRACWQLLTGRQLARFDTVTERFAVFTVNRSRFGFRKRFLQFFQEFGFFSSFATLSGRLETLLGVTRN